jgi:hypothetical protein
MCRLQGGPKSHIYNQFMCPIEALLTSVFLGMIDNHFAYWFHNFWVMSMLVLMQVINL